MNSVTADSTAVTRIARCWTRKVLWRSEGQLRQHLIYFNLGKKQSGDGVLTGYGLIDAMGHGDSQNP